MYFDYQKLVLLKLKLILILSEITFDNGVVIAYFLRYEELIPSKTKYRDILKKTLLSE